MIRPYACGSWTETELIMKSQAPSSAPLPSSNGARTRRLGETSLTVYEAPRITFRQTLDRVAADCTFPGGKASPVQGCSIGSS